MNKQWTIPDLERLKAEGKIRDFIVTKGPKTDTNNPKIVTKGQKNGKGSKIKDWIGKNLWHWCRANNYNLQTEFRFHPVREWRFDWAIEEIKLAIEYEGLMSEKSRHTTVTGFTQDTDKYNQAQALGWRVIRITALNYKTLLQTINELK